METIAAKSTLFEQGIDMMLYGMGSVFVFLLALVLAITLMSRFIARFFPEPEPEPGLQANVQAAAPVAPLTVKIIQAAMDQHRSR